MSCVTRWCEQCLKSQSAVMLGMIKSSSSKNKEVENQWNTAYEQHMKAVAALVQTLVCTCWPRGPREATCSLWAAAPCRLTHCSTAQHWCHAPDWQVTWCSHCSVDHLPFLMRYYKFSTLASSWDFLASVRGNLQCAVSWQLHGWPGLAPHQVCCCHLSCMSNRPGSF